MAGEVREWERAAWRGWRENKAWGQGRARSEAVTSRHVPQRITSKLEDMWIQTGNHDPGWAGLHPWFLCKEPVLPAQWQLHWLEKNSAKYSPHRCLRANAVADLSACCLTAKHVSVQGNCGPDNHGHFQCCQHFGQVSLETKQTLDERINHKYLRV